MAEGKRTTDRSIRVLIFMYHFKSVLSQFNFSVEFCHSSTFGRADLMLQA